MTRFGVMKHVGVLEDAGLVTSRREGRTKLHYLNPVPIGLVADRWISKYAAPVHPRDGRAAHRPRVGRLTHADERTPTCPPPATSTRSTSAPPRSRCWEALHRPGVRPGSTSTAPPSTGPRCRARPTRTSIADGTPAVDGTDRGPATRPSGWCTTWHTLYDAELAAEPVSRVEWIVEPAGRGPHPAAPACTATWRRARRPGPASSTAGSWILDGLKTPARDRGVALPPSETEAGAVGRPRRGVDGEWHRMQAVEANNSVWELIEQAGPDGRRTTRRCCSRAYAARYHWARASGRGPANVARGDVAGRQGAAARRRAGDRRCATPSECLALLRRARPGRLRPRLRPRGDRPGAPGAGARRGGGPRLGGGPGRCRSPTPRTARSSRRTWPRGPSRRGSPR